MGDLLELGLLGPFEVRIDGGPALPLGGLRQRALLAVLALHANEVVSKDRLIDELWGEHAPAKAGHTVQVFVSRLRSALGAAGERLLTRPPGYVLELGLDELDSARCEHLYETARAALAGGDAARAALLLGEAQAMWRGAPLADFTYEPFAQATIARLEELRVSCREELIDAALALGRHAEVVPELEALVREHPFRERPHAQLMLALYRCGRQADALDEFQRARRMLVEQLAVEPGATLRELEQAILRQDTSLDPPSVEAVGAAGSAEAEGLSAEAQSEAAGTDAQFEAMVRRTATLLVGRLSTAGPTDPETARRSMATARRRAEEIVARHGGAFVGALGGELVWVFGVPLVREDDVMRALRAAEELRTELTGGVGPTTLTVGLGLATGEVVAESSGEVFGDPLTHGHTLTEAATAGEILLAESTRCLAPSAIRVEPAGGGAAWRLLGLVPESGPTLPLETPMVGRDAELSVGFAAFDRAVRSRESHLLTVLGDPGIGKSRFAQELVARVNDQATVLIGRCLSYGEGVAFWPLQDALSQGVGVESREELRDLLGDAEDADVVADIIATTLGLASVEIVAEQVPWAFRRLLEVLSSRRPVVFVIEDAHWAEPALLDLIDHLVDWLMAPTLFLCLARPDLLEVRPAWGGGHARVDSVVLSPLDDEDARHLLSHHLGNRVLSAAESDQILETAEGNPLFVEQLLQASAEETWWDPERTIPGTIQSLLAARLDRLGPGERAYIERAALIGREFWSTAVIDLLPTPAQRSASQHLSGLIRRGFIHPDRSTIAGEEQLRFHHILIRDVAYRSASKELRAELHERFAGWLEARGAQYDEFVGYHLERSYRCHQELNDVDHDLPGLAMRAANKLSAAGHRAFQRGDTNGSVQLLRSAVELLDGVDEAPDAIRIELGSALTENGDFPAAHAALQKALEHARAAGDERQAASASIALSYWRSRAEPESRTEEMRAVAERSIVVFERFGDDDGLSRAWRHIAWADWVQSRLAAMEEALERSMRHAERAHPGRRESQLLSDFARAAVFGPRPVPDGIQRCHGLLRQAEGDVAASAYIEGMLAILEAMDGRLVAARTRWHKSKQRLSEHGLEFAVALSQILYGFIELFGGDPTAAEPEIAHASAVFERCGDQGHLSTSAALFARLLCAQRRYDEAQKYSDLSRRTASDDDVVSQVIWRGAHAWALVRSTTEHDTALQLAHSAVARAEGTDFTTLHAGALLDRAEVLTALSLPTEAAPDVDKAAALYMSKGIRLDVVAPSLAGRMATLA